MKKYIGEIIRVGATILAAIAIVVNGLAMWFVEQHHISNNYKICLQLEDLNHKLERLSHEQVISDSHRSKRSHSVRVQ